MWTHLNSVPRYTFSLFCAFWESPATLPEQESVLRRQLGLCDGVFDSPNFENLSSVKGPGSCTLKVFAKSLK